MNMSNKVGDKMLPLFDTRVDGKPIRDIVINPYAARNILVYKDVEKVTFDVEVMLQLTSSKNR